MQLCPHCGFENIEGVLYCTRCGIALVAVPLTTRQLDSEGEKGGADELGAEGVLIVQIEGQETPLLVQMRKEVILGRVTETSETTTYINLSPYGGDEHGVSRRHARLLRDGSAVYVTDLHSTNGTRINGDVLAPSVDKRIRDGDELLLGRLKLYIYFKT